MTILETRNLCFKYPDGYEALRGIDITIAAGEMVALLGANGSGKTTLFLHLNGLLQAQEGEVLVDGQSIRGRKTQEIFKKVGMVFQDPNDQLFAATVYEDVSFAPVNIGLSRREVHKRVEKALRLVGMWEYRDKPIQHLSYGQKKRVAIAGILAIEPPIIILDEPTAGLDPAGVAQIMGLLSEIRRKRNCTVLISTHNVEIVPVYCQKVYVLHRGQMASYGTPHEVFSQWEALHKAGLRLPRVAHLAEILRRVDGLPLEGPSLTLGEARETILGALDREGRHEEK